MVDSVKVTVIAHSRSSITGKEIFTLEAEYPRIVLAEANTHNAISKNASSSRAIPVPTMIKQVRENPAYPARFGAANTGMQDKGEHNALVYLPGAVDLDGNPVGLTPEDAWAYCANVTADLAEAWHDAGYAKQICNRWIETAQLIKVVWTATEWNNFMWLRDHDAADPTIAVIARKAKIAMNASTPVTLNPGEWHTPYYNDGYWIKSNFLSANRDVAVDKFGFTLEHALTISSSCTAQVSYRKLDDTIEKAKGVVTRLNLQGEEPDQPVHASPLEHQGTPVAETSFQETKPVLDNTGNWSDEIVSDAVNCISPHTWQEGITHMDRDGMFCSGNLKGWIQHRQLVPNHVKRG